MPIEDDSPAKASYPEPLTPLGQLDEWDKSGYIITLRGGKLKWTCDISTHDPLHSPDYHFTMPYLRAKSGECASPEEAIEALLKMVKP